MKGEINNNTITVGDFNTPLAPMDRSTTQKINKETQTLNDTMDQLALIDIYRTFHPKTVNFSFFSTSSVLWHVASLARPGHFGKGIRGPLAVAGMPDPLENCREAPPL